MATPQIWDGGAWVPITKTNTSYWDGGAWVEPSDIKYWDGGAWTTIFGGGGGGGSITFRAAASNFANTATSLGVTIPASVQAGDLLVLFVAQATFASPLFNAITGWTKQGERRAGTASYSIGVFTRVAQVGDAGTTVTSTSAGSANHYSGQVRAYAGVDQVTPLDTTAVFADTDVVATSFDAPAITVVTTDAMLLALYGVPTTSGTTLSATDWTDPTNFNNEVAVCTNGSGNNTAIAAYDRTTPGTGSQGPFTATITQSRRWASCTLALRPA